MRIGIDAREVIGRPTGVGRYLSALLSEWAVSDLARRHEFVLYAHELLPPALDERRFSTRVIPGPPGTWWEQIALPARVAEDRLDLFFSPGYTTALRLRTPTVVAIHDVSFFAHPEWFGPREGLRRRWLTYQSAQRARRVVTISEFSKRELVERLGLPEHRVQVVEPGVTPPRQVPGKRSGAQVLFVGSIFNRRHVPDLIRAFTPLALARPAASLDVVGDNRSYPFEDIEAIIASEGLRGRATWRAYVPDDQLQRLYAQARAFAFLSEYEGLGLTPLEALAWGIPSVLLDTPVAREACQGAALYVTRDDHGAITRALDSLLFDERTRRELLARAPSVLARYDPAASARRTLAVLEQAA